MPTTTHQDIISAPFPPLKPGNEVLPHIHSTHEMPSLAGCSLSRIIHQLQDTTAWQESQWTMRRPGIFCPLLSIFSTGPLYFFSPYSYWSSFTMGSFLGKRIQPCLLLSLMPATRPRWSFSPSPAALASLMDTALFLVVWLI